MLIGLPGFARSGKDTAADFFCERFHCTKYSFATPIKEAVKVMFSLNDEHVNGDLKEVVLPDLGVSPRFLMQTLGTEWGRNTVNSKVWLLAAKRKLENTQNQAGIVISDVRFENEATFIRENGGVLIHIIRDEREQVLSHVSDQGIGFKNGYDIKVNNNKSLSNFYRELFSIFIGLDYAGVYK